MGHHDADARAAVTTPDQPANPFAPPSKRAPDPGTPSPSAAPAGAPSTGAPSAVASPAGSPHTGNPYTGNPYAESSYVGAPPTGTSTDAAPHGGPAAVWGTGYPPPPAPAGSGAERSGRRRGLTFGGTALVVVLALAAGDRKSTRLNSSHPVSSRMPSSA